MLCTNGHNNGDIATSCAVCGVATFQNPVAMSFGQSTTNGLAIASMVLGIVWIYGIGAILALIFGYRARGQIKRNGQRGGGMAIAGIVLGWVGVAGLIFVIIFVVAAANSTAPT